MGALLSAFIVPSGQGLKRVCTVSLDIHNPPHLRASPPASRSAACALLLCALCGWEDEAFLALSSSTLVLQVRRSTTSTSTGYLFYNLVGPLEPDL